MSKIKKNIKRKVNGYNLFCGSLERKDFKEFGKMWRNLTKKDKQLWNRKAAQKNNLEITQEDKRKLENFYLSQIKNASLNLQELDISVGGIIVRNYTIEAFGNEYMQQIIENDKCFLDKFTKIQGKFTMPELSKVQILKKLRKEVQDIFNSKYSEVIGNTSKLPYSKVESINITGLPNGIPFRKPCRYGPNDCRKIICGAENIRVSINNRVGNEVRATTVNAESSVNHKSSLNDLETPVQADATVQLEIELDDDWNVTF